MKLLSILIFAGSISISANSYSQKVKLDVDLKNSSIREILKEIEKTSEFIFFYNDADVVNNTKKIDMSVKSKKIEQVMDQLFEGTDLTYLIDERQVFLYKNDNPQALESLKVNLVALQDEKKHVTGTIKDAKGLPLVGATIIVKGTTIGVIADADGHFTIEIPNDAKTIVISFMGMESKEVSVVNKLTVDVSLADASVGLDAFVLVGYGTQKRENLTSAVSIISQDFLNDRVADTPSALLSGLAQDVRVDQTNNLPGAPPRIEIRQTSTYQSEPETNISNVKPAGYVASNAGEPLYVIDGMTSTPEDFNAMNSSDIESITILKDAAATAIYGVKGGNGVMLITTKTGKTGKSVIQFTTSYSSEIFDQMAKPLNAYDFVLRLNELNRYGGRDQSFAQYITDDELEFFKTYDNKIFENYWKTPVITKHNLSLSGGSAKSKYYISGSYLNNNGALSSTYSNATLLAKFSGEINDDWDFAFQVNASQDKQERPYTSYDGSTSGSNFMGYILGGDPTKGIFSAEDQLPTHAFANLVTGKAGTMDQINWNFQPRLELNWDIPWVKGLSAKASLSISGGNGIGTLWRESPKLYYEKFTGQNSHIPDGIDWERAGGAYEYQNGLINGEYQQSLNREYRRNLGHQANLSVDYDNTFGKHNVHVYVGLEDAKSDMTYISGNAVGFLDPTNRQFGASLGVNDVNLRSLDGGVRYDRAMSSFISRADYNFRQKYIVGFTLRGDASYKFPKDSQIGWFPAASVGWNIAKEPFFNPLEGILSQLKLRGSYGMTGSDNTAAWQWQNVYTLTPATVLTENDKAKGFKLQPSYTPNQLITWEKNYSSNIGIDMSMPNRLVTFSADWWTRKTTDILGALTASIPVSVGASLPAVNYGSGKSWGWGFTVGHNNTIGDFKYSINANASTSDSKYLVIDQAANVRDYENLIGLPMRGVVRGYVLDVFIRTPEELAAYVEKVGPDFRINGQIPKMGDIMYKDIRGLAGAEFADEPDGKITKEDQEILSYNGTQKWRYGISSQIAWKGLSLSLIMDGTFKHKAFIPISNLTQTDVYADMWSPDHPTGTLPIPPNQYAGRTDKFVNSNLAGSAFWLKDWSYLRVKNISLSYSISEKLLSRTKFIKGLRVNGNIENPFYIINPFDYISPAQGTGVGNYPVMKAYSAGVTVTF